MIDMNSAPWAHQTHDFKTPSGDYDEWQVFDKNQLKNIFCTHRVSCVDHVLSFHKLQSICFWSTGSQRSPKAPSKTIQLTNNGPAIATSSFLQLPHNGPAYFKKTFVPTTTASTGLQADNDCHFSLNDVTASQAFSTATATMTATMTKVLAITTAFTKAKLLKLDKCLLHPTKTGANNAIIKSESLLLHAQISSAIQKH
jgi:hypothetical protein